MVIYILSLCLVVFLGTTVIISLFKTKKNKTRFLQEITQWEKGDALVLILGYITPFFLQNCWENEIGERLCMLDSWDEKNVIVKDKEGKIWNVFHNHVDRNESLRNRKLRTNVNSFMNKHNKKEKTISLDSLSQIELQEMYDKAVKEENYELAGKIAPYVQTKS